MSHPCRSDGRPADNRIAPRGVAVPPQLAQLPGGLPTDETCNNQMAGPVHKHQTGPYQKEKHLQMASSPTVLYLIESGSVYAEARAHINDPGYRDPSCRVDPDGTKGHRCVNRNGDPLPRGHSCWVNARLEVINHDGYWDSGDAA